MYKILIVDDETAICRTLQMHFSHANFEIQLAHKADDGIDIAGRWQPQVIILDIKMPDKSGIEALPEFKQASPNSRIIMVTAFQDMKSTIDAIKNGADEYIHKPIDLSELDHAITRSLRFYREDRDEHSFEVIAESLDSNLMIGRTKVMKEIFKTIGKVAPSLATVLITGESGTGKELVAKAIHQSSSHGAGPFVAVNCAALIETLLESDMFGHEKGAFTGAVNYQQGKFELAENGTIFLDEIGEMPLLMQAKLLRVLQEKEITPVGGNKPIKINARVIAATNCDLKDKVDKGGFRQDLYYRLLVVNIHVPPLRERTEDIPYLAEALIHHANNEFKTRVTGISNDTIECFMQYDWPGNVRELENTLIKAATLCPHNQIDISLIPEHICHSAINTPQTSEASFPNLMSLEDVEKAHTLKILTANHWHKGKVCEILGVSRPRLRRLIAQYGFHEPTEVEDDSI